MLSDCTDEVELDNALRRGVSVVCLTQTSLERCKEPLCTLVYPTGDHELDARHVSLVLGMSKVGVHHALLLALYVGMFAVLIAVTADRASRRLF